MPACDTVFAFPSPHSPRHAHVRGQRYEPFMRMLSMDASVSSGWNHSTKWHTNKHHLDCFYLKTGCDHCDGMFTEACGRSSSAKADGSNLPASFHALDSLIKTQNDAHENKLKQLYATIARDPPSQTPAAAKAVRGARLAEERYDRRLADLISEAFAEDFKRYQYPLWDGESAYHDKQY